MTLNHVFTMFSRTIAARNKPKCFSEFGDENKIAYETTRAYQKFHLERSYF